MKKRVHLTIKGNVQGVSFRYYTTQQARTLNITGWIKNKSDGTVEIMAEGEQEKLEAFVEWCWHGPPYAKVDKLDADWKGPKSEFDSFEMR